MSQDEMCISTGTASSEKADLKQFYRSWDGAGKITMRGACQEAEQYLASCEIADAAVDAWYLLEYVTGVSRAKYLTDRDKRLSREQWDAYAALIEKRGAHIPLQYLIGEQEFMGLPFLVNEDVLIPRQDTEILVEMALTILKTEIPTKAVLGTETLVETTLKAEISAENDQESGISAEMTQKTGLALNKEIPDWAFRRAPYRVLDLCTGSGCIAISIAKLLEQWWSGTRDGKMPLEIYASDISEAALAVARGNADRLDVGVHFMQSDLFDGIARKFRWEQSEDVEDSAEKKAKGSAGDIVKYNEKGNSRNAARDKAGDSVKDNATERFDMIVSNPPYIRTAVIDKLDEEVRLHEPHLALDGGEDGLVIYRKIIREVVNWLKTDGWLLFEIGYDQGEKVSEIMRQHGFSGVRVTKDLAGLDRVVSGQWRTQENAASG